jgi:hypothetical protein
VDDDWREQIPDGTAESTLEKAAEFVAMVEKFLKEAGSELG